MEKSQLPEKQKHLVVAPQAPAVVLAEDGDEPLALVLPPDDDLQDIASLRDVHVLNDILDQKKRDSIEENFRCALEDAKEKLPRYHGSSTYLNRLANLAAAAGDLEQESEFIDSALKLNSTEFLVHRKADNLLARRHFQDAEALFAKLELSTDLSANLKLAMFHVRHRDLAGAARRIDDALAIDPSNYGARLFQGGLCLLSGDFERAIHAFRLAASERPNSSVLFANLGIAYLRTARVEKAFGALRRAVALDPLNANAVYLLADLAFEHKCDEEVVPSLRLLLTLDQKQAPGWARLARAWLQLENPLEAISALKMQASLSETSAVWNNLGVARMGLRDPRHGLQAFKRSMELAGDVGSREFLLAGRNITQFFASKGWNSRVLKLTQMLLAGDAQGRCLEDPILVDLYAFYLHALYSKGDFHKMVHEAKEILNSDRAHKKLIASTISALVVNEVFREGGHLIVRGLLETYRPQLQRLVSEDPKSYLMVFNNIAFAYAEIGLIDEAEVWLRRISAFVHREPYPTATLGLIDMRKGNISRGKARYLEAVNLAKFKSDKARLRQKLRLELARYWIGRDAAKGVRLLEKVLTISGGEDALTVQARSMLRSVRDEGAN